MLSTGKVVNVLRGTEAYAVVDVIGVGAGVVDRLEEQGFSVIAFNAGERAPGKDLTGKLEFVDARSWAWWRLRDLLNPANGFDIALPLDDRLLGDLTSPNWKETSSGKIRVESKKDIRRRLGRSTDAADAVIQAFIDKSIKAQPFAVSQFIDSKGVVSSVIKTEETGKRFSQPWKIKQDMEVWSKNEWENR